MLRATKNLAKMIHKSVINAKKEEKKGLSAIEPLPEQSGTFLSVEIRADLRSCARDEGTK